MAAGLIAGVSLLLVACGNGDDTTATPLGSDAGVMIDATAPPPTVDACVFDPDSHAVCNACIAPDADPYNACSPFASGCIPFDAARVPAHPTL
jgi:hypothetical protein